MNNPIPHADQSPLAANLPSEKNSAEIVDKFDTATASHPIVRSTMEQQSTSPALATIAYTV